MSNQTLNLHIAGNNKWLKIMIDIAFLYNLKPLYKCTLPRYDYLQWFKNVWHVCNTDNFHAQYVQSRFLVKCVDNTLQGLQEVHVLPICK